MWTTEIASRTQSDVVDVDEMIAQAKAEAENQRARNLQRKMKQLSVQKQKLLQNLQKTLLRSRV